MLSGAAAVRAQDARVRPFCWKALGKLQSGYRRKLEAVPLKSAGERTQRANLRPKIEMDGKSPRKRHLILYVQNQFYALFDFVCAKSIPRSKAFSGIVQSL